MRPLDGIKVLDLSRLAPGPHCTMVLADFGADVLKIEEPTAPTGRRGEQGGGKALDLASLGFLDPTSPHNPLNRGKKSLGLNLKTDQGREIFLALARDADIVVEEFRPGVTRRLSIDYDTLKQINQRLIYCAITGFGQDGPLAQTAGHDINCLGLSGLLSMMGPADGSPAVPQNLIADYAGGALQAVIGILAALIARQNTGQGQFIDVSMTEGAMSLLGSSIGLTLSGGKRPPRGRSLLDGQAPFYAVYETADRKWLSVGAIEPWFFANLCRALGHEQFIEHQFDEDRWPEMRRAFAETFGTRARDDWGVRLGGRDTCVAPVIECAELLDHPQHRFRRAFAAIGTGAAAPIQVAPQPRLSDTPASTTTPAPKPFQHTDQVLRELGYDEQSIAALRAQGVVRSL